MSVLYELVLALHIASIAIVFGALSVYPSVLRHVERTERSALPALHRAQGRLGGAVVTPAAALALLTGVYLATAGGYWAELWVSLPLSLLTFVLGVLGAYLAPTERRLERLAAHAADGESATEALREGRRSGSQPNASATYAAVARRLVIVSYASSAALLLALVLMVLKPS